MKCKLLLFSCGTLSVLQRLKSELFGQEVGKLKTICITTAANVYPEDIPEWQQAEMDIFEEFGLKLETFDLENKTPLEVTNKLSNADVIYVTGGNTYFLLEQMQKTNFADTLKNRLENGAVYIGCSAGSAVVCPRIDYIEKMDDPSLANLTDFSGLNLIDFYIMPHTDHEKYGPQAKHIIENTPENSLLMLGLQDNQAIYINGNYMEVFE